MGQNKSSLAESNIKSLSRIFSEKEIIKLHERFSQLDRAQTGTLSSHQFLSIPELAMNPLSERIIILIANPAGNKDPNLNNTRKFSVSFEQFVQFLSHFSSKAPKADKLHFAFNVYDVDGDGFIGESDLVQILRMLVGETLSDSQIQKIASKTIADADVIDFDGRISFNEFKRSMWNVAVEKILAIEF